jgi:hypothetical protein
MPNNTIIAHIVPQLIQLDMPENQFLDDGSMQFLSMHFRPRQPGRVLE